MGNRKTVFIAVHGCEHCPAAHHGDVTLCKLMNDRVALRLRGRASPRWCPLRHSDFVMRTPQSVVDQQEAIEDLEAWTATLASAFSED